MGLKTKDISIPNYERVIHAMNETTNLNCIIAIHNTKLGPALGGVRSWPYNNFEEQLNDALRLSKAMSLKNSVCGINFGGGKAVINLKDIKNRRAKFITFICLIISSDVKFFEGMIRGNITHIRRGDNGFGYDPIVVVLIY